MKLQITYDRRFTNSLRKAKRYIAVEFGDRIAAKRLEDNIRKEINKRMSMHSLNIIPAVYAKTKNDVSYYRILVGRYMVFYYIENGAMVVARLLHSSQDIRRHLL